MWPFIKNGSTTSTMQKVVLSLWYVFLFVWFLLVVFRIWHLVNSVHDETVIMTEGKSIPVWKSAFPAITICSQIKFSSPKFNFTQAAWTTKTKSEKEELVDASVLCDQHVIITDQDKEDSTLDMHNFIREAAHSFDEVLYSCSWKNELTNCSTLFKPTFTEEGLCFTFNAVDIWSNKSHFENHPDTVSKEWDMNNGYKEDADMSAYPRRANLNGLKGGLSVVMLSNDDDHDHSCTGPVKGFKVHIHNPAELPVMSSGYLRVSPNKEVTLAIEPEKISISDELKHFPMWRMCSLQNEEQLDYFNHWTQKNCFLECLSKFTYEECHCVPYYMPAGNGTKICSGNKKRCYLDAEEEWSRKSMDRHVLHGYDWECGCSPDCSKDVYKYQYSTSEFNWQAVLRAYGEDLKHFQGRSMSRVTVYIADILNVDNHVESFTSAPFDTWGNLTVIVTGLTFILLTVLFFIISVEQSTLQSESSYKEPLMNINMS